MVYYNLGKDGDIARFREEFVQYQEAIRINPRFARAYYNIGVLYGEMGNYREELQAYKPYEKDFGFPFFYRQSVLNIYCRQANNRNASWPAVF